ncbi:hypothetical protein DCAR_0727598 [Daucus carota subsp. sativus]|uniref:RING-type domain-containing protein n=1 Tax=Daucus carota subsp. sativus TaxID=79200 RepID=A0AAF0XKM0_DAUCS|nr:PREDICTED: uncharacterized protein LOC108196710 [Daucus carota subsp. sativus]WOH08161.1 hypothetical protein DCAR_0727598 [Daucus carota subsp. sativus]
MDMVYYPVGRGSYDDYFKLLEADVQHANALAAAVPRGKDGARLQMKLVYNDLAPFFLFLLQWIDSSCTCLLPRYLNLFEILVYKVYTDGRRTVSACGRRATVDDFYAVILPSLLGLNNMVEMDITRDEKPGTEIISKERLHGGISSSKLEFEREAECGICLEPCAKIVLPTCCHAMCINCYRDWNARSKACPFCRGNIKRVMSRDLWVLTCGDDVVETDTVLKEDLRRFYLYISKLPKDTPDSLFFMNYEYLI